MSMFDKNISQEKLKSLEFAEAAREQEWKAPSFALKLFHGSLDFSLIHPFPKQDTAEKKACDDYMVRMEKFLRENLNPDEVDKTGDIPKKVYQGLGDLGAFALKIPKEYGGMGFSQYSYNRIMHLISSYCGSTAVLLSAHQSIGVPQPLKLFGTPEQKKKYLPMFAKGAVSAFALTEPEAGSDPRNMSTTATPTEDGKYFLLNGTKLWCTNGLIADVMVVMAVTPPKVVKGKEIKQITAFIVEGSWPGIEKVHRCSFMGLHGIQNGLMRFNNVRVPRENILLGEGEGLKLALVTLNTGRLTLPAASAGIGKWCLNVCRQWSTKRHQWGSAIGEHEAVALKLNYVASHAFAMDAVAWLTSAMADDKHRDIRLEAAIAKLFSTETSWQIVDTTLQIRGGQGYETSESLAKRGMDYWPVERAMRDVRINRIIEGTSDIMHLFIAREALDPHLSKIKPLLSGKTPVNVKMGAAFKMAAFYAAWYPKQWLPPLGGPGDLPEPLNGHMMFVQDASKKLARLTFHAMMKYQQKLEAKQSILNRIVDIGMELFVISAVCSYAAMLAKDGQANAVELADSFCIDARNRIEASFKESAENADSKKLKIAKKILAREFEWLENQIIK
ncbi:MAG: acyl-CoA dehydrogenase family protein [Candidatus Omnitrophica bacterium]|nr:acyl-CoA dehydrogenase family protein [Candidatus Omnitrophota bacterium]MDE2221944.1 acyl-CoA dehydrogenase family protein [Candidatus Omnitrophota bacterium]